MLHDRNARLRFALFAALGLSPSACGNVTVEPSGEGGGSTTTTTTTTGSGMLPPPETPPASPCEGATLVLTKEGMYTGFARCPDGTVHRLEPAPCDAAIVGPSCLGNEDTLGCTTDSDCTAGPHGRCIHEEFYGNLGTPACMCQYACKGDNECDPGQACVCKDVTPMHAHSMCTNAACIDNTGCASGECGLSHFFDGCGWVNNLACRAEGDACRLDGECGNTAECQSLPGEMSWSCHEVGCISGRPLQVEGAARTAPRVWREDFRGAAKAPSMEGLDEGLRAALAEHWARIGAMEHASVGSFARFTLELLALGAPPELLAETQRAALDEVAHAELAYGLASAYAGRGVGPGPLSLAGVVAQTERDAIVAALIEEACVGETLAAAEAAALAEGIEDEALRAALRQIADDELRHAALGFKALAWMLRDAGDEERAAVLARFEAAMSKASRAPRSPARIAPAQGLCAGEELGAIRRAALREIVRPCMEALLGERREARAEGVDASRAFEQRA